MIHRVEVKVSPRLAGEIADGNPSGTVCHRFTFGERIDNLALDCLELCLEAIYLPPSAKKAPLLRLNIQLEKLRIFWRMVSEKKWISLNQLAFVISKIDEIGRMTGEWIKTLSSK